MERFHLVLAWPNALKGSCFKKAEDRIEVLPMHFDDDEHLESLPDAVEKLLHPTQDWQFVAFNVDLEGGLPAFG